METFRSPSTTMVRCLTLILVIIIQVTGFSNLWDLHCPLDPLAIYIGSINDRKYPYYLPYLGYYNPVSCIRSPCREYQHTDNPNIVLVKRIFMGTEYWFAGPNGTELDWRKAVIKGTLSTVFEDGPFTEWDIGRFSSYKEKFDIGIRAACSESVQKCDSYGKTTLVELYPDFTSDESSEGPLGSSYINLMSDYSMVFEKTNQTFENRPIFWDSHKELYLFFNYDGYDTGWVVSRTRSSQLKQFLMISHDFAFSPEYIISKWQVKNNFIERSHKRRMSIAKWRTRCYRGNVVRQSPNCDFSNPDLCGFQTTAPSSVAPHLTSPSGYWMWDEKEALMIAKFPPESNSNSQVRLFSSVFTVSSTHAQDYCAFLHYRKDGNTGASLSGYLRNMDNKTEMDFIQYYGVGWRYSARTITIPKNGSYQLVYEAKRGEDVHWAYDIALSKIELVKGSCEVVRRCRDQNICQNSGKCKFSRLSFKCVCPSGFTGRLCQYEDREKNVSHCPSDISIPNGALAYKTGTQSSSNAFVSCKPGYVLDTIHPAHCSAGHWLFVPKCVRRYCPPGHVVVGRECKRICDLGVGEGGSNQNITITVRTFVKKGLVNHDIQQGEFEIPLQRNIEAKVERTIRIKYYGFSVCISGPGTFFEGQKLNEKCMSVCVKPYKRGVLTLSSIGGDEYYALIEIKGMEYVSSCGATTVTVYLLFIAVISWYFLVDS